MAPKIILSDEQKAEIFQLYSQYHTYAEVSRQSGLSAVIVKRVLEEGIQKPIPKLIYNGIIPPEPYEKLNISYYNAAQQLYEDIKNDGIL